MKILINILLIIIAIAANAQLPKDIINQNCFDSGWPDIAERYVDYRKCHVFFR
jgi:hypothetical protein